MLRTCRLKGIHHFDQIFYDLMYNLGFVACKATKYYEKYPKIACIHIRGANCSVLNSSTLFSG